MTTTITEGWPIEYAGPSALLEGRSLDWVRSPRIRAADDGAWAWVCEPLFVANEAFEDWAHLRAEGWDVILRARTDRLIVKITEREN